MQKQPKKEEERESLRLRDEVAALSLLFLDALFGADLKSEY